MQKLRERERKEISEIFKNRDGFRSQTARAQILALFLYWLCDSGQINLPGLSFLICKMGMVMSLPHRIAVLSGLIPKRPQGLWLKRTMPICLVHVNPVYILSITKFHNSI